MKNSHFIHELEILITTKFIPLGYQLTKNVELDCTPEAIKYNGATFVLNNKNIIYRKAKITPDRPGGFLTVWQRPTVINNQDNKPIAFTSKSLDYLLIQVEDTYNVSSENNAPKDLLKGLFIFSVSLLIEKGIVSSSTSNGKTAFRVFPPWSEDRGLSGSKVFSDSGKKTQRWQLPYFIKIGNDGLIDSDKLNDLFMSN